MIELWDYLLQLISAAAGFALALRCYYRSRQQPWFLLSCFYGTFALGTLYWTLHLLLRRETPQVFYVADLAWAASFVFLLALALTLPDPPERGKTALCWLVPAFYLPQFALYVTYGDVFTNVLMCGTTMAASMCAVRALRCGSPRRRGFYAMVLVFAALEYALWTSSCFWLGDTPANPYFWFDLLLTLALPLFVPALGSAGEA